MNTIRVINKTHTHITRHRDPNDEWDADDISIDNNITGIEIVTDEKYYGDLDVPFEVKPNQTYYLLYAIYGTGDSFCHSDGNIDYIELYEDINLANSSAQMIADDYKSYEKDHNSYSCEILNSQGNIFKMSCPWKGYFESLEDVDVIPVNVKKKFL
jgi:hypothetical protein